MEAKLRHLARPTRPGFVRGAGVNCLRGPVLSEVVAAAVLNGLPLQQLRGNGRNEDIIQHARLACSHSGSTPLTDAAIRPLVLP